jgi:hypothetical protein
MQLVQQRRVSAVYIDQPIARQLDLIHAALPGRTRLGIIFGPSSWRSARSCAWVHGSATCRCARRKSRSGWHVRGLPGILPEVDVLLALPDAIAFNSSTAYLLMLASYRAAVPVVGSRSRSPTPAPSSPSSRRCSSRRGTAPKLPIEPSRPTRGSSRRSIPAISRCAPTTASPGRSASPRGPAGPRACGRAARGGDARPALQRDAAPTPGRTP